MIVIVGAGITGLALGHELGKRGLAYRILEASERPGGVVRSGRVAGHLLDWGPQRTRLVGPVRELVRELGLEGEVLTAPAGLPLFVYASGTLRRVPVSAREFIGSDLVSLRSKLRVMREPLTAAARPGESVAGFFTRKLGREVYEKLAGPLYGGLYASDPADMLVGLSLGHALRELGIDGSLVLALLRRGGAVGPPDACSFAEGMQTLPDALYRLQSGRVRLDAHVTALRRAGSRYRVELADEAIDASAVVLTVPAPEAARLLAHVAPEAASRVRGLVYNPLAVVHLHGHTALRGLGFQVSLAERFATRGVTFNDSLFGRTGIYTAYLGGARAPEVVSRSDAAIAALAVREFRALTGCDAEAVSVAREYMPAWNRSWSGLADLALPPGLLLAANWESRPGIPGRLAQAKRLASASSAWSPEG